MTTDNLMAAGVLSQDGPALPNDNADLVNPLRPEQARRFLRLLGKDPAACWFRTIRHGKGANSSRGGLDLQGLDLAALTRDNRAGDAVYLVVGDAAQATGKGGGVKDADITAVPALFVEWDDMPLEWQVNAWQTLDLPEPSLMVASGGKSLHCYWLLDQPLEPVEWRRITARLIAHCNSDPNCKNPSRVMRLPGFAYIDKATGKPTGTIAEILHESDHRYSAAEIEACLPAPQQQAITAPRIEKATSRSGRDDYPAHTIEQIQEAAQYIPQRRPGSGDQDHYAECRNALSGCAAALAAIGRPEEQALDLLADKWPDRATAAQILDSTTTRNEASFWAIAQAYGYRYASTAADALNGFQVIAGGFDLKAAQGAAAQPRQGGINPDLDLKHVQKRHRLTHDEVVDLLPRRMGRLRLNVRSGEVETEAGTLGANQIGRLYLQLSSRAETWPKEPTADAVALLASQDPFDPVAEYLQANTAEALPMEQWQRLDQHLLGIDDPIAAAFLPRYLIGAVARVFEPGCDVRQLPVLVGPQWRGKTALGRILFGASHWVEGIGELGKDDLMKAHTSWGVELAELDGVTRRADQERLKAFLTETCDTYRKPYDRAPERHVRRFVFWGTSNGPPLRDGTGSTRFVVIPLPDRMLPLNWAQEHRDALWARAVEQYRAGAEWRDCSEAERQAIAERNNGFQEIDPWAEELAGLLANWPAMSPGEPMTIRSVFDRLEIPKKERSKAAAARIRSLIESQGWIHDRRRVPGGEKREGFWPPEPSEHPFRAPWAPCGHPKGAQPNASDEAGSEPLGTLGTLFLEKLEKREGDVQQGTPATPDSPADANADNFSPKKGAQGARTAETPVIPMETPGHPWGAHRVPRVPGGVPTTAPRFAVGELVELDPALGYAPGAYEVVEPYGAKWAVKGPLDAGHAGLVIVPADACEVVF